MSIEEIIKNMESGIYDFTKDGKCSCCGACCSNLLPMSEKEVKNIKRYVNKKHIKEQKHLLPSSAPTLDMTCPFRNEEERKCLIYNIRPAICRDFQCDKPQKKIQANKAMYHGRYRVVDLREEFFPQ